MESYYKEVISYERCSGHHAATVGCDNVSRPQHLWNSDDVQPFTGSSNGLRTQKVSHVNKDSTPITVSSSAVDSRNKYYNQ